MQVSQKQWTSESGWEDLPGPDLSGAPHLVLAFGGREIVEQQKNFEYIHKQYPDAHIVICSTAGEIGHHQVLDNALVVTAITFDQTHIICQKATITDPKESFAVGQSLSASLPQKDLTHVMVFSEGLHINGTQLVSGLQSRLPEGVSVTGGLVGDGSAFKKTVVGLDAMPTSGTVVVVGFYGTHLRVGYGSLGGWDAFGLERVITKSHGNILYELDHKPALSLYKQYLGAQAHNLPSSGLLFPLSIRKPDASEKSEVVRTILAVNEADQSMTFAGDMPEGTLARLMKANFERLIDGASGAAHKSIQPLGDLKAQLAILISCIGRKLILKERTEEEVEAVREIVGDECAVTGFYSYGEICPGTAKEHQCKLHNQTMTITTFREET